MTPADESPKKNITLADILEAVAEYYQITTDDLTGESRIKEFSEPRQIVMFLGRKLTTCSTSAVGNRLGGRDHTTIMYGDNRIKERLSEGGEENLRLAVKRIIANLAQTTKAEVNFSFVDNLKIFCEEPPSDEFCNAIFHTGTDYATCEACGRVFFNDNPADEIKNIEELRKLAIENSDQYHNLGDSGASIGTLDGINAVYGCPCNFLRKYERLIYANRFKILQYLQNRRKTIQDSLDNEAALAIGTDGL